MPNSKQDRARLAGEQDHEVKYVAGRTGGLEGGAEPSGNVGNTGTKVAKELKD